MAVPPMIGPNHQRQLQDYMRHRQEAQWLQQQKAGAAPAPKDMLEQAAEHYQHRRYAEAGVLYRQLTAVPLVADQAHCNLGVIALAQGDIAAATEQFRLSLAANPGYANALYYLGDIAEKSSDAAGAASLYGRALAVNPNHAGARAAMARLSPASAPATPATPADALGVYEFLRAESSLLSRQTVDALAALNFARGGAFTAWLGPILLRLLMWIVIFVAVSIVRLSSGGDYDEDLVWLFAGAHLAVFALRAVTTKYSLHNGRLTVSRGLIWRRTRQTELWRIQSIDLQQGLVDRITGHGGLIFHGLSPATPKIEVRGVARGAALKQLHQHLVDLVFLLRGNAVVKGIIS